VRNIYSKSDEDTEKNQVFEGAQQTSSKESKGGKGELVMSGLRIQYRGWGALIPGREATLSTSWNPMDQVLAKGFNKDRRGRFEGNADPRKGTAWKRSATTSQRRSGALEVKLRNSRAPIRPG